MSLYAGVLNQDAIELPIAGLTAGVINQTGDTSLYAGVLNQDAIELPPSALPTGVINQT
jgi:hypothetical protein